MDPTRRQRCIHAADHLTKAMEDLKKALDEDNDTALATAIGHAKAALDHLCRA